MTWRLLRTAFDEVVAHPVRTLVLVVGAALAVTTFAVMSELGRAGQDQLDATVQRTQGRPGTVLVSIDGLAGSDVEARLLPEMVGVLTAHEARSHARFAVYAPSQFACLPSTTGGTPVARVVIVDGDLYAVAPDGALTRPTTHAWSLYFGEGAALDGSCLPAPSEPLSLRHPLALRRLGLDDGDVVYPAGTLVPSGPAEGLALVAVLAPDDVTEAVRAVQAELTAMADTFTGTWGLPAAHVDVARVDTAGDFTRAQEGLRMVFFLAGLGALVLGGLAILNVQLMAVSERTRILGLYRAVGARSGDLRALILLEAVVTVVLGVAVGFAACVALAVPLRQFAHERFGVGIDLLAMDTLGVAAVSAVVVGTLAGWLPARRAGRIDIVSALERE